MIRTVLAVASVAAIALGVSTAIAQQDPVKERKALMKEMGQQAKIGGDMIKGDAPFDLQKAHKIFATVETNATKAPALFAQKVLDEPTADDPYTADPKIWDRMDDFKARLARLGDDAKAADAKVTDLDSFKAAFSNMGKNDCGSCHETYRHKKE
jgi:cytochrome c556